MEFSGFGFLFRFLPIFLIIYYLVPSRFRNLVLFLGSITFYAIGEPRYIFLLLFSVAVNYLGTLQIGEPDQKSSRKKGMLVFLLCLNVGILLLFKYSGFLIPLGKFPMPLGISFYTFTVLSYVLDVYFGREEAEDSFVDAGVYMMMFPKLISGPIATYSETRREIKEREITGLEIEEGLMLFIVGLAFKTILANHFGMLWHDLQSAGFDSISTAAAWLGVAGYSAQLFFDFQGYSLMAVGVGRMLGFHLPHNFRHPYRSKTVGEYYRRWHISLGSWFKNYLYIPLGGNRKGRLRMYLNLFLVWVITGIWHGVTLNFLIWGLTLFFFIALEKICLGKLFDNLGQLGGKLLPRLYIWFVIPLTWIVFAIDKTSQLGVYFTRLFPFWGTPDSVNSVDYLRYLNNYTVFFGLAFLVSLPFADKYYDRYHRRGIFKILLFGLFWICIYQLANGLNNPFLYFRF